MIQYYEDRQTFHLTTQSTSYVMALADGVWLGHLYYGAKLADTTGMESAFRLNEFPYSPKVNERDKVRFMQVFPLRVFLPGNRRLPGALSERGECTWDRAGWS